MNKNNYTYKKLGEVCDAISAGGTPPRTNLKYWKGNIPWVKISNIKEKYVTSCDEYITEEGLNNSSAKIFKKGTILYTIFATIGEVGILDFDASTNQAIAGLTLKKGYDVDFYYHYLKFVKDYMMGLSKGVAQNNINLTILRNLLVPVPPLATQRKIVAELDCLNNIIAKKRLQLQDYDSLAQALFHQTFGDPVDNDMGWEVSSYGNKFTIGSGGTPSKSVNEYWENGNIPWIGSNMCQNTIIYSTDGKYITESGLNNSSTKLLPKGTLLIALVGATIGKVGLLACETATNQNIANVNIYENSDFIPIFMFYHTMSLYSLFMNLGESKFKMANQSFIRNLPLILPPLALQQQFAAKIEAIEAQKARIRQSVVEVQTLLNYTMDKYFG